jgi:uncharacterized protein YbjT (DUF2867 family)
MIEALRDLAPPGPRLLAAAWERARGRAAAAVIEPARVRVLGEVAGPDSAVTLVTADDAHERVLVMSWIGAHPDTREPLLERLWKLEEAARATGLPTIVLRFGPLIGRRSPLLALLAQGLRLDRRLEHSLIQPLREDDAIEGVARLLAGRIEWSGWYEVCGPDARTVGELRAAAVAGALGSFDAAPAWEPSAGVLRAQGVVEWRPWADASGVTPRRVDASAEAPA